MKFLIFGGSTNNKGAEAMTLILINEIKKKCANAKIILAVRENEYKNVVREGLAVDVVSFQAYEYFNPKKCAKYKELVGGVDKIIDISGYMLSSDFMFKYALEFFFRIGLAKFLKKPIYFLPQSFGPLLFKKKYECVIVKLLLKTMMPYPKYVFARERSGYLELKPYCKNNLKRSLDMVLTYHEKVDLEKVYKKEVINSKIPEVIKNSVAIVPNKRNITNGCGESRMREIYSILIEEILKIGKNVYLIPHSVEDVEICKKLKKKNNSNENVFLVEKELHCFEFEKLISEFDYAIVSRYHALVHSYKEFVPCIILGWADKYEELAGIFQQKDYVVDTRRTIKVQAIVEKLHRMEELYTNEQQTIKERYESIKQTLSYDWL